MNILHVVNISFVLPYFIGDQFSYFKDKGYSMNVICSPSTELIEYSKSMNFKFKSVKIVRAISPFIDIIAIFQICRFIKKNKINIVVGHTPKAALLSMIASKIMGVPKRIYFRHGLVFETMSGFKKLLMINLDRLASLCATKIVCVSPSVYFKSIDYKLNPQKKQVVLGKGTCGGIDAIDKFNPINIKTGKLKLLKESLNFNDNYFTVGFCGRLVKDKGIIELVEAFDYLKLKNNRKLQLLLVGDFEERDSIPNFVINKIKNNKNIIVTGFITKDIQYYYSLMDLFILPSSREGFPTSVLEASSMKLPVLTTKVTGCIDSIIENVTGVFIDKSTESIVKGIETILNYNQNSVFGDKGREFVLNDFDNSVLFPEIEKLYI